MVLVRGLYRRVNQSASNGASRSMYQVYNNPNLNNRQNPKEKIQILFASKTTNSEDLTELIEE